MIVLVISGIPAPKGSGRAMMIGGKARHVPSGSSANQKALRSWDSSVKLAVESARITYPFVGKPLSVTIEFSFVRPACHFGTGRNFGRLKDTAPDRPTGKPDIDKLARSTLDAMTGLVFDDDSRIVQLFLSKWYAHEAGARVKVSEWTASK